MSGLIPNPTEWLFISDERYDREFVGPQVEAEKLDAAFGHAFVCPRSGHLWIYADGFDEVPRCYAPVPEKEVERLDRARERASPPADDEPGPIEAVLVAADSAVLRRVADPDGFLDRVATADRGVLLAGITPHDDTVFNASQMEAFLREWDEVERLVASDADAAAWRGVRDLALWSRAHTPVYLRFTARGAGGSR